MTRKPRIAVLAGDGIGPEVTREAVAVLSATGSFGFRDALVGGCAIDARGVPLPKETLELCQTSDAVLLGAVGGPRWEGGDVRPEQGLLELRKELGLFANLRPVTPHPGAAAASPIKPDLLRGFDLMVVRELTGGIYFGRKLREGDRAEDVCAYTVPEVERVVRVAAGLARTRRHDLTSVDKANVLETSRLWRSTTERVIRAEFPDVRLRHMLVDAAAMHLLRRPADFDVIVTENLFGDILTDEASVLAGSMGLVPSASLGSDRRGLYEPIHGSAPDIAGRGIANPLAAILSAAMLLRHSLDMPEKARAVESAVAEVIAQGPLTPDVGGDASTSDVGKAVRDRLAS